MSTCQPKIGITERGDAATDLSWINKLSTVDGCVVITKNPTHPKVQEALLKNANKCILHATITGWGGSVLEPNVPMWPKAIDAVTNLVNNGFPREHVVIRVDPVMPWDTSPSFNVINAAYARGFRRFRLSVLDTYTHMTVRFHAAGLGTPHDLGFSYQNGISEANQMIATLKHIYPDIVIEACAEPGLNAEHRGCVSDKDLDILGLSHDVIDQTGYQRPACMCYSGKTELLTNKKRCPHQCLYCYWKD